jgi:hypothetical protein
MVELGHCKRIINGINDTVISGRHDARVWNNPVGAARLKPVDFWEGNNDPYNPRAQARPSGD